MKQRFRRRFLFALHASGVTMLCSLLTLHLVLAQARPDPGFTQVAGPPFDAVDVWIDSELNGYGSYFAGSVATNRTPVATGDPLWPEHVNRVYARVRNFGDAVANSLTIRFYVRQPAGIGDGGFWELIGTLSRFGPVQPRSFRDGFITWTPASDAPVSFKVEVQPLTGEASTTNNTVIEGSSFFADDGLSALSEVDFAVHNPSETSGVNLFFEAVITPQSQSEAAQDGSDWQVVLDPESHYLRAGFDCNVQARVLSPNPCLVNNGKPAQISILGSYQRLNQPLMRFGGATLFARSTRGTAIVLECTGNRPNFFSGRLLEESCLEGEQDFFRGLKRRNEPILVEYRSPVGRLTTRAVRTDTEGAYSDRFTTQEPGIWQVQAHWIGDQTHSQARSAPCLFQVTCPAPTITCPANTTLVTGGQCQATYTQMAQATSPCNLPVTITGNPPLPVTFNLPGDYTVTFTAKDSAGTTANCTAKVTVVANGSPTANAGPDQDLISTSGIVTVTLNGTGSGDPDGQTITYLWQQISGPAVTLSNPASSSPSFSQPNDAQWREFQLTVGDPCGVMVTDTVRVRVRFP